MISVLAGIDGRNPTGFLAALGTLRLIADHLSSDTPPRLAWTTGNSGQLHPVLAVPDDLSDDDIPSLVLDAHQARDLRQELGWTSDVMRLPCEQVRELVDSMLVQRDGARSAQTLAACVVDVPRRQQGRPHPDRLAAYTPLRLIPRVGRAAFVGTALKVSEAVTSEKQLRTALFGPWRYEKANSLRWDPGARPPLRAYSAEAPTNFGPLGVPGAVALAVAGLCYFPVTMTSRGRVCRGFDSPSASHLRWPIWRPQLDEDAVRATLSLRAIHDTELDTSCLARHGVFARVSAKREQLGPDDQMLAWGEVDMVDTDVRG